MKRRATFRKSLASLLITTLVILGLLCSDIGPKTMAAEELSKEDELYREGLKEESLFQRHAAVANGRIMNSFAYDEHGMWIFPEDYAGTYIDGEFLIVCLKEPDQESINYYLSLAEDEALFVQVKEVIYSQNELQLIADSQAAWFNEHGISVYSYWVDPQSNGISFLTAEADVQKARIEWDKKYPDISCHVEASEELTPTTTYLYGGDAIVNPSYSSTPFTLGACGTRYGSYAIITAGHACTATGQSIKKYGSSSAFSSVVQRSYPLNSYTTAYGDYAVANITDNSYFTTAMLRTSLNGNFTANKGSAVATVNTIVYRFGRASGYGTGKVTAVNVTITYYAGTDHSRTITGMTKIQTLTNGAVDGDSGGPYAMYTNQNEYCICGIQSGGTKNSSGVCVYMNMTPYALIHNATGFNVETDN